MNELGISLVWLAVQVTLLCLVTGAIYFVARRRHPAAGATAALTGLLLSAVLSLGIVSPWPRWSFRAERPTAATELTVGGDPSGNSMQLLTDESHDVTASPIDVAPPSDAELESPATAALTAFWKGLGRELTHPTPPAADTAYRWSAWLAVSLLLAMAIGAARLAAGWMSVRASIRRSRAIDDRSLNEMVDVLRAELGCRGGVELRESVDVASAATVGWRKPLILLPRGWRDWSDRERRTVLAHELAHVTAGDAATWLAAQVGLLLHFYHPLVHWLTHRLRLEQELAADALAARLTGSSQTYLTTLAELAVRQPDRPIAWPARAFLPTRGTLLRRIEMLRDTKAAPLRSSTFRRITVIALTLAAGLFVAGLRPPEAQQAVAQQRRAPVKDAAKPQAAEASGFNLQNVPASTGMLLGFRPAQLASRPELEAIFKLIDDETIPFYPGLWLKDMDQFLFIGISLGEGPLVSTRVIGEPVMEIRMKEATDFAEFLTARFGEFAEQPLGGTAVLARKGESIAPRDPVAFRADDRTLIFGLSEEIQKLLDAKRPERQRPLWLERFAPIADHDACVVWDMEAFRPYFQRQFEQRPNPFAGMFVPLWQKTRLVIGGAKVDDRLTLTVNGWASDADDAARLEKTLTSLVPFATGLLETAKASAKQGPPEMQAMLAQSLGLAQHALDNLKVQTAGDRVTVTVEGDAGSVATFAAVTLPAVQQAREAARRTLSRNNLKQIGLAFHNFHDVFGYFPPPVLYGNVGDGKSKHPHSWRVAILPYIDQANLYNQYRFDEPWDSEHNLKIAQQIPAVFRSPNDDPGSTNAAYYVLVGENTAVGEKPEADGNPTQGRPIREFTDGTSNTLLVVEAKRDIPWTKPEDIAYSPDADLPPFGGFHKDGFHGLLADGAVRFISEHIDEKTLRALVTRNGGEVLGNF